MRSRLLLAVVLALTACQSTGPAKVRQDTVANGAPLTGTVVSLTFDDGTDDQFSTVRPLLAEHGMHGTFYVNSGRLGTEGYVTVAQLAAIATDGNEIGGHTITHADLPTLSRAGQQREICNDRVALTAMGFSPVSFAYPYGDANPMALNSVQACGYNSARTVGGLVSPGSCQTCAYAESLHTRDPFLLSTSDSVKGSTNLEEYVTQAKRHGGGWVPLVFHHVCDACADPYSIQTKQFAAFLDWLKAQGTTVRTVGEVIGGTMRPTVPGPPSPLQVQNPTMSALAIGGANESSEIHGIPACFEIGGYSTNTFTAARTKTRQGYTEQLTVTGYDAGARSILTRQDAGSCAPGITPGHTYQISVRYQGAWSRVRVRLSLYYLTQASGWTFWTSGPSLPASGNLRQATVTTPPVPAGATNISFGIGLSGVGTLQTSDYSLTDVTK